MVVYSLELITGSSEEESLQHTFLMTLLLVEATRDRDYLILSENYTAHMFNKF